MNRGVADVGLFNCSKGSYSRETQQVLKVLMDEAKFTNMQRSKLNNSLRNGEPLPKALNNNNNNTKRKKQPLPITHLNPNNYKSNRRSQAQILSADSYLRDQYQPTVSSKYGGSYEREKTRLSSIMAYGEDLKARVQEERMRKEFNKKINNASAGGAGGGDDEDVKEVMVDRFTEIQGEIAEREEFMRRMEECGRAGENKSRIYSEISQLIREMELIDRKRTRQLEDRKRNEGY